MKHTKLKDIGEFKLLHNYIFPIVRDITKDLVGDDCAILPLDADMRDLVITTDAGPKPLVMSLGYKSYYAWGWYTIAVNVSDLASTGAEPLTVSLSIDAPNDMFVYELEELYLGIRDACLNFHISLSGGNIRASKIFSTHCTAIGYLKRNGHKITRSGCQPNDILVSIGENGRFISNFLKGREQGLINLSENEINSLVKPSCSINEMRYLNEYNFFSSASDNSDGILGSLQNIKEASHCGFEIDFDNIIVPDYIKNVSGSYNKWNLFLFWGDWQIIGTIRNSKFDEFKKIAASANIQYTCLGKAIEGSATFGVFNSERKILSLLRNENFTEQSFNNVIINHVDYLLKTNIISDEN